MLPGHGEAGWPDNSGCCTPSLVLIRFSIAILMIIITWWDVAGKQSSSISWSSSPPLWLPSFMSCFFDQRAWTNLSAFPSFNWSPERRLRHCCCYDRTAASRLSMMNIFMRRRFPTGDCDDIGDYGFLLLLIIIYLHSRNHRRQRAMAMSWGFLTRQALLTGGLCYPSLWRAQSFGHRYPLLGNHQPV